MHRMRRIYRMHRIYRMYHIYRIHRICRTYRTYRMYRVSPARVSLLGSLATSGFGVCFCNRARGRASRAPGLDFRNQIPNPNVARCRYVT